MFDERINVIAQLFKPPRRRSPSYPVLLDNAVGMLVLLLTELDGSNPNTGSTLSNGKKERVPNFTRRFLPANPLGVFFIL
jgi:hypothetical protein